MEKECVGYSCELQPPEACVPADLLARTGLQTWGEASQARSSPGPRWGAGRPHAGLQSEVLLCSRGGQEQMLWALSCPVE